MVRAKGGSIKVYYKDYKEICLDDDNNVIFKMMFNKYTIEDMNLDDVFNIIASIE
jgi:hypothetical protein